MTTPKIATSKRNGSRFYVHPETAEKVPGVTSIVGMLPKPFLAPWNGKMAAEYAVDNYETIGKLLEAGDRQGAVDLIKGAARRSTYGASDLGTAVHSLFERIIGGEKVGALPPDLQPFAKGFHEFLAEFEPKVIALEETVWSDTHSYAGTFDAILEIGGEIVVVDWKTTRSGVYPEVALQLAAYRYADSIVEVDGSRREIPAITGGAVLHARPEGWNLHPVRANEEVFGYFVNLRAAFEFENVVKSTVIGHPVNENPVKIGRY